MDSYRRCLIRCLGTEMSIKRAFVIGCGLLLLAFPLQARSFVSHYMTFAGMTGVAVDHNYLSDEAVFPVIGTHDGLAVGYALQYNHFLFATGIESSFRYLLGKAPDYRVEKPAVDSQNDDFILRLDYTRVRHFKRGVQVALPVRLGGQWERFYCLGGLNLSARLADVYKQISDVTATADYGYFCIPFSNMPNHGLTTTHLNNTWQPIRSCFSLEAALEIGCIVAQNWRLALYADVCLWKSVPFRIVDSYNGGLKISYWFNFPHRYPCHCLGG